ncbi:MAG: 50S ribosomal protein L33 [Mycoplasmataceae bacterium]|nr:50S ribosomal protein L33 [Mycoplasmataceae bacterium]
MKAKVVLACEVCNSRNYHLTRNKYSEKRLELKKYCAKCNKVTTHKETK